MRRLGLVLLMVALTGAGFGATFLFLRSPHWALYQVGKAIHNHEPRLFLAYVDVGQILQIQKNDILDLIMPDQEQRDKRDLVRQLINAFMGPITEQVRERLGRLVADQQRDNLPSSWALLLAADITTNGDNALVVLRSPQRGERLRLGMQRGKDAYWRVVQINVQDLRQLAAKHLLPDLSHLADAAKGQEAAPAK